jgi:hypothetical protein
MSDEPPSPDAAPARPARGTLLQTLRAVLWSFFGVRRRADQERDAAQLNPFHVILVGIAAAAAFVAILIGIVQLVVRR